MNEFIEQPQGLFHESPKTLSIVETSGFNAFFAAWEALSLKFKSLLDANNDADIFAHLRRARVQSLAFEGYFDQAGTRTPSLVDIGSFLEIFELLYSPTVGSVLETSLEAAQSAYDAMFVLRRSGPGTPAATGMHIMWPFCTLHAQNSDFFSQLLFDDSLVTATSDAPNYQDFLQTYYASSIPPASDSSVCTNSAVSDVTPVSEGDLFLNPMVASVTDMLVTIQSDLAITIDYVLTEFGVNMTHLLSDSSVCSHLLAAGSDSRRLDRRAKFGAAISGARDLQEDFFLLLGGDVAGSHLLCNW